MNTKFDLGHVYLTNAVNTKMKTDYDFDRFVKTSLGRFSKCDWGNTNDEDKRANDAALESDDRIMAVYKRANEDTIWIITEADRSATTILFPSEY